MIHAKQIRFGPRDGSSYTLTLAITSQIEKVVCYVEQETHRGPWIAY